MKSKIILLALFAILSLGMAAQESIHFIAGTPAREGLSRKNAAALKLKVEQILARNNAGTASESNVYVIQPELVLGETKRTEGLVRNVTLVTAELSLTARNREDGSTYATVTMEVQGDTTEGEEQAIAALISQIKVTDRAFVRFIRTARKRIADAAAKAPVESTEDTNQEGGNE